MNRNRFWFGPLREAAEEGQGGGAPPKPEGPTVEQLAQRLEALETSNAELEEAARFWEERATRAGSAPAPANKVPEDYDPTEDINQINAKGFGAIKERFPEWAKELGYLTKAEAEAMVTEANTLSAIARNNPDLADESSEFRKVFVKHLSELDGLPQTKKIATAAKMAKLELQAAGKYRAPETEEERTERILAQAGIPTVKRNQAQVGLDAKGKEMAAAMGVDEETFKKYAQGVDFEFSTGGKA